MQNEWTLVDLITKLTESILFLGPRRYHEGLGNVTPHDPHTERHLEIIRSRKEIKSKTLAARIIRPAWSGGIAYKVSDIFDGSITHYHGLHTVALHNKYKGGET